MRRCVALLGISMVWLSSVNVAFAQSEETGATPVVEIENIDGLTEAEPVVYQVTLPRVWAVITPSFLLDAFLDLHGSHWAEGTVNLAYGGEFIIRRIQDDGSEDFDLVFSVDWADISMPDTWWLEADDPIRDADWGQNDISILTFDVAINWVTGLTRVWDIYYGVGLGVGFILGDFLKQDIDPACLGTQGGTREISLIESCPDAQVEPGSSAEEEDGVPPLIPALSFTFGTRWTIADNWIIQLEGGWKSVYFYGGLELGYAWGR